MDEVDSSIRAANLDDEFHIWGGQCLSIAKVIHDHFGGDIIFVTEIPGEGFDHALVEIEGRLYDGSGRVDWGETVSRFVAPEAQEPELEDNFYYPDDPFEKFDSAFDESVYERAYELISDAGE